VTPERRDLSRGRGARARFGAFRVATARTPGGETIAAGVLSLAVLLAGCELVAGVDEKALVAGPQESTESTGGTGGFSGGGHIGAGDGGSGGAPSGTAGLSAAGTAGTGGSGAERGGSAGESYFGGTGAGTAGTAGGSGSAGEPLAGAGGAGTGGDPGGRAGAAGAVLAGAGGRVGTGGAGPHPDPTCDAIIGAPCGPYDPTQTGPDCLDRCVRIVCGLDGWEGIAPRAACPSRGCTHEPDEASSTPWECSCHPGDDTLTCG
jgi:hypothetical protein